MNLAGSARRARGLGAAVTAIGLLAAIVLPASPAGAKPAPSSPDGPSTESTPSGPSKPSSKSGAIDLATFPAQRWIVQLQDAPVVSAKATGAGRLDTGTTDNVAYRNQLRSRQADFTRQLAQVVRGAQVDRTYQVVLNGLAVKMSPAQAQTVRRLPSVKAVTPDIPVQLDMFSTPAQIGAPTLWNQVGGQSHAGEGVKVAVIDSGIYVTRDANGNYAGNPCFNDTGYRAPSGFPKGDTRFTNNKVIVARSYFRPGDPPIPGDGTAIQGPGGNPHGTHTAGTVACDAGTQVNFNGVNVTLSGVAPRAYLMNYRIFYPSTINDDFQNGNGYVAEIVQALDDAVNDGADVISASWGSSYQNTLAWPDPMVQAAEAATDAGVVGVFANGNDGPDQATSTAPSNSPKVIGVGAVTKNTTIVRGVIDVTAPQPVPANLVGMPVGSAQFGPSVTSGVGPAPYIPAVSPNTNGCNPFPAGSMTGAIALVQRGTCTFSQKVYNAQQAGAIAAIIYNSAANGDNLQGMGPGVNAGLVTIPSWFMRRSQGLAMKSFALAHPGQAAARFVYQPQVAANIGDVMAGFSSRGPTKDKTIKPDVVAPGVDIVSSGYGSGPFPAPFTGFGSASGTSMATPHVAGSAALLVQLHPEWTPAQVKSALMTTATEKVYLDTALSHPAQVLDRGSGRIDLTKAGNPGLTIDQPSLSVGEVTAGQAVSFTINATWADRHNTSVWDVSTTGTGLTIAASTTSLMVSPHRTVPLGVQVSTPVGAAAGDYEGEVVLTERGGGRQLHVPVWLGVRRQPTKDVLLVDDDGSSSPAAFADYSASFKATLNNSGLSYDYVDVWQDGFPAYLDLYNYRAVVIFTGDNNDFNTSGFSVTDQNALNQWLDSGGRLWTTGQNYAETSDSNTGFSSPFMGRSREYHGYLGLRYDSGDIYAGQQPPSPTATGAGLMAGLQLDLGATGDGAHNQTSIEASDPFPNNDTFQAANTMSPLFQQRGGNGPAGSAISFSRGSEPSLAEERVMYRYRSISMGFGLEGVNGTATRTEIAHRTLSWLLDQLTVSLQASARHRSGTNTLTATATSSSGAPITSYLWDFGDGTPIVTTATGTIDHAYHGRRAVQARVEVIDALGHHSIAHVAIDLTKHEV